MTDVLETKPALSGRLRNHAVSLLGIGTATPLSISQEEAATLGEEFGCHSDGQRAWLRRVFSRCGVERRATVLKKGEGLESVREFYPAANGTAARGPTTEERMKRYAIEAPALAQRAALAALDDATTTAAEITHLITVSCTGFHAPGLDVELIGRLGLRPNVRRLHIGFMGCHAAFNALAAARDIVRADSHAVVLVCCVELSTLHFAYGFDPEKLVANALFADGSAACVMGGEGAAAGATGGGRWRLAETASMLLPESREAMTWRIGDHGFEMTLSAELPALIGRHLRGWCDRWLGAAGLEIPNVKSWAIHPGGPKILNAVAECLGLVEADLTASRAVLARHGNMSSTTVLFVLQELARNKAQGPCVAIGFGPGLMAEGMLLENAE